MQPTPTTISYAAGNQSLLPCSAAPPLLFISDRHQEASFSVFYPCFTKCRSNTFGTGLPVPLFSMLHYQNVAANLSGTGLPAPLQSIYYLQKTTINITGTGLPVYCSTIPSLQYATANFSGTGMAVSLSSIGPLHHGM